MTHHTILGNRVAESDGMLLWVWSLIALGVTAAVSVVLSSRGLWHLRMHRRRIHQELS